jgi:predicted nucleic acid-binding protein
LIVLDASLGIDWLFQQAQTSAVPAIDAALRDSAVIVPSHWPLEIANTLVPELRSQRISIFDFHAIIDRLDKLNIQVEQPIELDEIGPTTQFAVQHGLTSYDAAYVQLALQRQATLGTLDRAMRRVAATLSVPLLPLAAE